MIQLHMPILGQEASSCSFMLLVTILLNYERATPAWSLSAGLSKILGLGHPMNTPQDGYWANGQVPDGKVPKYVQFKVYIV